VEDRLHKISPSDSILLLILLVLLPSSLLSLLFGGCTLLGFASASAHPEMGLAEAIHNIAISLALPLLVAVPLPLSTPFPLSVSFDMVERED
jgi:hypothetical protein